MNSITTITDAIISLAVETSADEALTKLKKFAQRRQNNNLVYLVAAELNRRIVQSSARRGLVISGEVTDEVQGALLSLITQSDNSQVVRDDTDVLAGIKIVGENKQIDLSVRRQLDRLAKELVTG